MSVGLVAVILLSTGYKRIVERRDREGMEGGFSNKEMSEMGDRAPIFRYMLCAPSRNERCQELKYPDYSYFQN
jgi:hypothetical protein